MEAGTIHNLTLRTLDELWKIVPKGAGDPVHPDLRTSRKVDSSSNKQPAKSGPSASTSTIHRRNLLSPPVGSPGRQIWTVPSEIWDNPDADLLAEVNVVYLVHHRAMLRIVGFDGSEHKVLKYRFPRLEFYFDQPPPGEDFQSLWISGPRGRMKIALQQIYTEITPFYCDPTSPWRLPPIYPVDRWNLQRIPELFLNNPPNFLRLPLNTRRCFHCYDETHTSQDCPARRAELDAKRTPGICNRCDGKIHSKAECPIAILRNQIAEIKSRIMARCPAGTTSDEVRRIFEHHFGPSNPRLMTQSERNRVTTYHNDKSLRVPISRPKTSQSKDSENVDE